MRVITFDHRGVGRSESLTYAYTTEAMADDAVSILDDLGDRPRPRLRLLARRHGRPAARAAPPGAGAVARPRRDAFRRTPGGAFPTPRSWRSSGGARRCRPRRPRGPRCHSTTARAASAEQADRIAEDIERTAGRTRSTSAPTARSCSRRAMHNCYGRLDRIRAPTLRRPRRPRPRSSRSPTRT